MDQQKKTEKEWRLNRREALKLAGFAVSGATLGLGFGNIEAAWGAEKVSPDEKKAFFPHLFSPLKIGAFTVRNRILSTAHYTGFGEHGLPSERHRDYWGSKARGGIGLIFTDCQPVHPTGGISPLMIQCYRSGVARAFKPVVDEIHQAGGKIIGQVWHPGKSILPRAVSELVSSSAIPSPYYGGRPRALSIKEIQELVICYARGASRMREGGLDGVELHCAHNYLPLQFMSPLQNNRTDEYGGSEENRIRFVIEAIQAIRKEVGNDFTFGIRISGDEFVPGGLTIADMQRITPKLVNAGNLDYVNVSLAGINTIGAMGSKHGAYVYLAEGIKHVVTVPVFCIGRIVDPVMADEIVRLGRADMVGMTRANMCDPDLPNKARQGRVGEIRPCIGLMNCWSRTGHPDGITCALNPAVGREKKYAMTPALKKKRVMVIGSGAAGMEAARVAAERGHRVILYEEKSYLGGQLIIASKTASREEMIKPVTYYQNELKRLGVTVHLSTRVTPEIIKRENPDEVIVATGGLPKSMIIPGAKTGQVVQGRDVLMGGAATGARVIVIAAESGIEGLGAAEFLADQGKNVEVVIPQQRAGEKVEAITRYHLLSRLKQKNVVLRTNSRIELIKGKTVILSEGSGKQTIEDVDTVVLSLGSESNDRLLKALTGLSKPVHAIGQCRAVGGILESITDGLDLGLSL